MERKTEREFERNTFLLKEQKDRPSLQLFIVRKRNEIVFSYSIHGLAIVRIIDVGHNCLSLKPCC
jgi:hypothetical protein